MHHATCMWHSIEMLAKVVSFKLVYREPLGFIIMVLIEAPISLLLGARSPALYLHAECRGIVCYSKCQMVTICFLF